ncbi:MAG: hypothetical protein KKI20_06115 [Gammaproteobacteria bacterium]|nr:hypothetical protein [Gammaproteobacteria bacterium]
MSEIGESSVLEEATSGSEVLLKTARPDLYLVNSFRVTGLPVDATAVDIGRQAEKIKMMQKFGGGTRQQTGPLRLEKAPDVDAIREARQRLNDPERRLVDEFFWFWPHQLGQSRTDEALLALARGDVQSAAEIWKKQEGSSNGNVSMHNLAILSHIGALDLEQTVFSQQLSDIQIKQHSICWQGAFKRWKILLDHEEFWSRLTHRIREFNDPRLTTGTARRMRTSLPLALLSINAQLAVCAAEQGNKTEVKRHKHIMSDSGFAQSVIDEALRHATEPIRERIKILCKTAGPKADADLIHADRITKQLLNQTRPLLALLDSLLPPGNLMRDGAHDEVALCALHCQVCFGNKTENWKVFLKLLELLPLIAASQSVRDRIEENIKTVKTNLEYNMCWFCKERPSKDVAAIEIKMCGNVTRTPTWNGTQVNWQYITIKVPRCETCKSAHGWMTAFISIGTILGILVGLGGCIPISEGNPLAGLFVFGLCTAIGGGIGYRIGLNLCPKGMKQEGTKTEFPRVKELQKEGWTIGEKPEGVQ